MPDPGGGCRPGLSTAAELPAGPVHHRCTRLAVVDAAVRSEPDPDALTQAQVTCSIPPRRP